MYVQRHTVALVTDASGNATAYSQPITGALSQIRYVKADFADGVDFTVTNETTGETLWSEANVNASATRAPRQATHGTDGAASVFASGGSPVQAPILLAGDRIKVVVVQGGNTKSGSLIFMIG